MFDWRRIVAALLMTLITTVGIALVFGLTYLFCTFIPRHLQIPIFFSAIVVGSFLHFYRICD